MIAERKVKKVSSKMKLTCNRRLVELFDRRKPLAATRKHLTDLEPTIINEVVVEKGVNFLQHENLPPTDLTRDSLSSKTATTTLTANMLIASPLSQCLAKGRWK